MLHGYISIMNGICSTNCFTTTLATTATPRETPGVDALPTLDGNIILSWTPVEEPDQYIVEYHPKDDSAPARRVSI